jgi:hypothetical protein
MARFPTLRSACLHADKHPHLSIVLHTILICWRVTRRIVVTCPNYEIFTISHLSNVARRLSTSISPHLQIIVPRRQDQTPSLSQLLRLHFLPPSLFDQEVRFTKNVQETSSWTVLIECQFGEVRKRKDKRRRVRLQGNMYCADHE